MIQIFFDARKMYSSIDRLMIREMMRWKSNSFGEDQQFSRETSLKSPPRGSAISGGEGERGFRSFELSRRTFEYSNIGRSSLFSRCQ